MKFPFLGGAYTGRSLPVDAQTCRNLMLEGDDKTPDGGALVNTPGYAKLTTTGKYAAVIRGMIFPFPGSLTMCLIGNQLHTLSVAAFARVDNLGGTWTMSTTTGPVSMAYMGLGTGVYNASNFAVAVADGSRLNVYSYPSNTSYTAAYAARSVVFLDGRFIWDDSAVVGRFYYSEILNPDPGVATALNFATAEGSPDALQAVFADKRELYLFGEITTEVWYNTGDATNPFQRYQGGYIQAGCAARLSVGRLDNTIVWLATDEKGSLFVALLGPNYTPLVISTSTMNYLFSAYVGVSDAFCMTYRLAGHECYVLTFPTQDVTWVYDAVTKEWHQWGAGSSGKHPAQCMVSRSLSLASASANLLATTTADGEVYVLSPTTYTDNAVAVTRERTSHHAEADQKRIAIASLQLDMEEGVSTTASRTTTLASPALVAGDATITTAASTTVEATDTIAILMDDGRYHLTTVGAGSPLTTTTLLLTDAVTGPVTVGNSVVVYKDDRCTLETSKDGGHTFSTARTLHMGVTVTKALRVMLRRMGWARQWTVRFKTQAPVKIVIKGLIARIWGEP